MLEVVVLSVFDFDYQRINILQIVKLTLMVVWLLTKCIRNSREQIPEAKSLFILYVQTEFGQQLWRRGYYVDTVGFANFEQERKPLIYAIFEKSLQNKTLQKICVN